MRMSNDVFDSPEGFKLSDVADLTSEYKEKPGRLIPATAVLSSEPDFRVLFLRSGNLICERG